MVSGNLYQIIDYHKWLILPDTPIKISLDKDPSPVEGIQGHVPVFMETNNLGIYLLDEKTSSSVYCSQMYILKWSRQFMTLVWFIFFTGF